MIGSTTSASLWLPDAEGNAELDPPADGFPPTMLARQTADDFLRRVAEAEGEPDKWRGVSWEEVCRSLEVTDAVERSAARRRTIELHHEPVTEQETFKSMMAAGGCGMLIWVLLCLLVVGIVEGLKIPLRDTAIWQLWPALMFAPLAVFLALQLLQLVFPRRA
jgi:hypothetical protein